MNRQMLNKINKRLEAWMPFITPASVAAGLILSNRIAGFDDWVPWMFAFITFAGSLNLNVKDVKQAIRHPLPILIFMLLLHAVMPLYAWGTGHLFFSGDPMILTGLVLLFCIPTGVISLMWVTIYNGNAALTLTMILLDTLLSPLLVPFTLSALIGAKVEMDIYGMMSGLFWMVVLPSLAGMVLNQWSRGALKRNWGPRFAPFSKLCLGAVVAINSAVIAPYFTEFSFQLIWIGAVCMFVVITGYLAGYAAARMFRWDRGTAIAMTFNCGMRNISAGAVLAIQYFPAPVALPIMVAMLFQQMTASTFAHLLFRERKTIGAGGMPKQPGLPG